MMIIHGDADESIVLRVYVPAGGCQLPDLLRVVALTLTSRRTVWASDFKIRTSHSGNGWLSLARRVLRFEG